jgi:hypothetical protein
LLVRSHHSFQTSVTELASTLTSSPDGFKAEGERPFLIHIAVLVRKFLHNPAVSYMHYSEPSPRETTVTTTGPSLSRNLRTFRTATTPAGAFWSYNYRTFLHGLPGYSRNTFSTTRPHIPSPVWPHSAQTLFLPINQLYRTNRRPIDELSSLVYIVDFVYT